MALRRTSSTSLDAIAYPTPSSADDAANTTPPTRPSGRTNGPPEFPARTTAWSSGHESIDLAAAVDVPPDRRRSSEGRRRAGRRAARPPGTRAPRRARRARAVPSRAGAGAPACRRPRGRRDRGPGRTAPSRRRRRRRPNGPRGRPCRPRRARWSRRSPRPRRSPSPPGSCRTPARSPGPCSRRPPTAAAAASACVGGSTGSAGRGGIPENTSGKPNRLKRPRTCASNEGGCGSAASSVRTTADPRISLATLGKGPFARLSAMNQIAMSEATTATAEPATESALPNLVAARSRACTPMNQPAAFADRGDREQHQHGDARSCVRALDDAGRGGRHQGAHDESDEQTSEPERLQGEAPAVAGEARDREEHQQEEVEAVHARRIVPRAGAASGCGRDARLDWQRRGHDRAHLRSARRLALLRPEPDEPGDRRAERARAGRRDLQRRPDERGVPPGVQELGRVRGADPGADVHRPGQPRRPQRRVPALRGAGRVRVTGAPTFGASGSWASTRASPTSTRARSDASGTRGSASSSTSRPISRSSCCTTTCCRSREPAESAAP